MFPSVRSARCIFGFLALGLLVGCSGGRASSSVTPPLGTGQAAQAQKKPLANTVAASPSPTPSPSSSPAITITDNTPNESIQLVSITHSGSVESDYYCVNPSAGASVGLSNVKISIAAPYPFIGDSISLDALKQSSVPTMAINGLAPWQATSNTATWSFASANFPTQPPRPVSSNTYVLTDSGITLSGNWLGAIVQTDGVLAVTRITSNPNSGTIIPEEDYFLAYVAWPPCSSQSSPAPAPSSSPNPSPPPTPSPSPSMSPCDNASPASHSGASTAIGVSASVGGASTAVSASASCLTLTKATTTDADSVTVDYNVSQNGLQSVQFAVYRGGASAITNPTAAEQIGTTQTISSSTEDASGNPALQQGTHALKLISGVSLPPNTSKEFVVVVATYNGKTSTTYFRKWMLAALAHGFDRYVWLFNPHGTSKYGEFGLKLIGGYAVDPWEAEMASSLKQNDYYDDVIQFDWMHTCGVEEPGLAQEAGVKLANLVTAWPSSHIQHQGDVVDLHFIGHSRGTVVVTQALQNLNIPQSPLFQGSFVELTLLDPHPANNNYGPWADWAAGYLTHNSFASYAAYHATWGFQDAVDDPLVVIPAGVKHIEIWWQHTKTDLLDAQPNEESTENLWGEVTVGPLTGVPGGSVRNNSGIPITPDSLVNLTNDDVPGIGVVGHIQVPYVYIQQVVNPGALIAPQWGN
jgi:hypothetical protein